MKWFQYIFPSFLLLLALPFWRLIDWAIISFPYVQVFTFLMVMWSLMVIALPIRLMRPKLPNYSLIIVPLIFGLSAWLTGPLSKMSSLDPGLNHCGPISYSGFFYPIHTFLSNVHQDDLEIRNQMCWIRKMIQKTPDHIPENELQGHLDLMKNKLLRPTIKYRASLPLVVILLSEHLGVLNFDKDSLEQMKNGYAFMQGLSFWTQEYSEETSMRQYAWYEWPYSSWVKAEYGFIEANWNNITIQYSK